MNNSSIEAQEILIDIGLTHMKQNSYQPSLADIWNNGPKEYLNKLQLAC